MLEYGENWNDIKSKRQKTPEKEFQRVLRKANIVSERLIQVVNYTLERSFSVELTLALAFALGDRTKNRSNTCSMFVSSESSEPWLSSSSSSPSLPPFFVQVFSNCFLLSSSISCCFTRIFSRSVSSSSIFARSCWISSISACTFRHSSSICRLSSHYSTKEMKRFQ